MNHILRAELVIEDKTKLQESIITIFNNANSHGFVFTNVHGSKIHLDEFEICTGIINKEIPLLISTIMDGHSFKIIIESFGSNLLITINPLEPFFKRIFKESNTPTIDLAWYTEHLLTLCNEFAIERLYAGTEAGLVIYEQHLESLSQGIYE
jgi:hypothetical protein